MALQRARGAVHLVTGLLGGGGDREYIQGVPGVMCQTSGECSLR